MTVALSAAPPALPLRPASTACSKVSGLAANNRPAPSGLMYATACRRFSVGRGEPSASIHVSVGRPKNAFTCSQGKRFTSSGPSTVTTATAPWSAAFLSLYSVEA